jgi:predicted O-methyltransferase YrrM
MSLRNDGSKSAPLSPDYIRDTIYSFRTSRILLTAYELGVFTALGDDRRTSVQVAEEIKADERATDRLLNALCAMELIEKEDGKFSNGELTSRFLVEGKPEFMSGLMHSVNLWDSWSTLTEAVRRGGAVPRPGVNERGQEWLTAFITAMHARASGTADKIVSQMDLSGVHRVLDVGGGSGAYAMAFVHAADDISATVFDLPNVVPLTSRFIELEGLQEKIDTAAGDYNHDDLGSRFDLVFLSAIVHSNPPDANTVLISKCAGALNPGGQVVVQDFIVSEERTDPPNAAIFALNMLVGTEGGDTYTESEVRGWMEEAGLSDIARFDTDFGTTQITGRKPASG